MSSLYYPLLHYNHLGPEALIALDRQLLWQQLHPSQLKSHIGCEYCLCSKEFKYVNKL